MRGQQERSGSLFYDVSIEEQIPASHPLGMGTGKAALCDRSPEATVGAWSKSARQSGSSDGLRVSVI
jgi:hypothetical protein